jgi:hypothetical protein
MPPRYRKVRLLKCCKYKIFQQKIHASPPFLGFIMLSVAEASMPFAFFAFVIPDFFVFVMLSIAEASTPFVGAIRFIYKRTLPL